MQRNNTKALSPELQRRLEHLHDFVVLDVETTGFDRNKDHIIEIGMIKVVSGTEVDAFASFINPGTSIPPHITNLTGITDADVQFAPTFDEIVDQVVSFMGNDRIVGHNVPFDISFIKSELIHCGIHKNFDYIDTLFLARKVFPALKSHKLSTLIAHLGFSAAQSHRALDDARWTLKLLTTICERCSTPSLDERIDFCSTQDRKNGNAASQFVCTALKER